MKSILYIPDYMITLCVFDKNSNLSMTDMHNTYNLSYSNLHHMKKVFIQKNWVTTEKDDKRDIITLTEKGREIVQSIYKIIELLEMNYESVLALKMGRKRKLKVEDNDKKSKENNSETSNQETITNTEDTKAVPGRLFEDQTGTITTER